MRDKGNKKWVKDEDTKERKLRWISVSRPFGTKTDEIQYSLESDAVVRETKDEQGWCNRKHGQLRQDILEYK
jgi:hypothetical protein